MEEGEIIQVLQELSRTNDVESFFSEVRDPDSHSLRKQLRKWGSRHWAAPSNPEKAANVFNVVIDDYTQGHYRRIMPRSQLRGFSLGLAKQDEKHAILLLPAIEGHSLGDSEAQLLLGLLKDHNYAALMIQKLLHGEELRPSEVYNHEELQKANELLEQQPGQHQVLLQALQEYATRQNISLAKATSDQSQMAFIGFFNRLVAGAKPAQGSAKQSAKAGSKQCLGCFQILKSSWTALRCGHEVCDDCRTRARNTTEANIVPTVPRCPLPTCFHVLDQKERTDMNYETSPKTYRQQPNVSAFDMCRPNVACACESP